MGLEILDYEDVTGDQRVIGKFDLYLGPDSGLTFPNFKILRTNTGGWYVKRPSFVRKENSDGTKTWGNYPEMSDEKWKSLSSQLVELLKPLVKA